MIPPSAISLKETGKNADSTDDVPDGDAPAEEPVYLTDGSETEEDTPDPENETTDATDSKFDSTESDN